MRRVHRRKRPIDYILPFLILISIGVIVVMGVQLWSSWSQEGKSDVYLYVVKGKAKHLPFGETDWFNAFSGTKLLLGDSLKTLSRGRVVMEFFNDTRIRLDSDTAVTLSDVDKASDREVIVVNLENGSLWINGQKSAGVKESLYEVRTKNLLVKANGTIFEVESGASEIVRVFEGDISVDVLVSSNGQERVAETISVGVGQEITIDDATLKAYQENKSPSVLKAVSDTFKTTNWYQWNVKEDNSPTDFSIGATSSGMDDDLLLDEDEATGDVSSDDDSSEDDVNNEFGDDDSSSLPKILEPSDKTIESSSSTLSGTVPDGTTKVIVESVLGEYTLSKFSEGDSTWSYKLSTDLGNLKKGKNTYKVYALNEDGERSDAAEITITYGTGENSESDESTESVEVEGDLTSPKVSTFNGSSSSTVSKDVVTVVGEIKGAASVVVNGYTLSQFSAGDTTWKYVAKESLGNLSAGENSYSVYGLDGDGNKSSVVKFMITYNKPAATASSESTTTETETEEPEPAEETESSASSIEYGF